MKKVITQAMPLISFLALLCFAGGIDHNTVSLRTGVIGMVISLVAFGLSSHFLTKENRPENGTSRRR